jgi:hypothetical protein
MNKARAALLGTILFTCAGSSAQTTPGVPVDPGIVERPPAKVDPKVIERPPANVDPEIIRRPSRDKSRNDAPTPRVIGGEDLPSVILVPHGQAADAGLGNGCWVQFYNDKAYGGRSLTLVGPVKMPKMNIPGGLWVTWSSAVVGPNATVTTYDYEQFKNRTAVLRPRQRIPNLRDRKLGNFENIHSLEITCGTRQRR